MSTIPASISRGTRDSTAEILEWLASVPDNGTATFRKATYRCDKTLELRDRKGLVIDGNGATIRSLERGDGHRAHWRFVGGERCKLQNLYVRGVNPNAGVHDAAMQWQHAVDLRGANDVLLERVRSYDAYGDGVYVGRDDRTGKWSERVTIRSCTIRRTGRMGVAVTAGRDVKTQTCALSEIALDDFDVEPNGVGFGAERVSFVGNTVTRTDAHALLAIQGSGPVSDVSLEGTKVTGDFYVMAMAPGGQRRSNVVVQGNTASVGRNRPGSAAIKFIEIDGCHVHDNDIPLSGQNMALVGCTNCTGIDVSGNRYPGGVVEVR